MKHDPDHGYQREHTGFGEPGAFDAQERRQLLRSAIAAEQAVGAIPAYRHSEHRVRSTWEAYRKAARAMVEVIEQEGELR